VSGKLAGFISLSETTHLALEQSEVALIAATPALPFLIAERSMKAPQLIVAHSSSKASDIASQLSELVENVAEFPAWESLPHERLSPNSDTVARRIDTLKSLDKNRVIVTTARALLQPINEEIIQIPILSIQSGTEQNFSNLIQELVHRAYNRVDMVEKRGDFAVRGGLIDLFPPLAHHPVRIEFFGDEIEEIRYFEVSDQRTFACLEGALNLIPCRELILTPEVSERARQLAIKYPEISEICNKAADGIYSQGLESLLSVLSKKLVPLLELLPKGFEIMSLDQERIALRVKDLVSTNGEFLAAAWSSAALSESNEGSFDAPLRQELSGGGFLELDEATEYAANNEIAWRYINPYGSPEDLHISQFSPLEPFRNNFEKLIQQVKSWINEGFLVVISLEGIGILERYRDIFADDDIAVSLVEKLSTDLQPDKLYLISTLIRHGFVDQEKKIVFITEAEITGDKDWRTAGSRMPSKRKATIDPLELKSGDYVVHEQHGVGRYLELAQRDVAGISREYLVIEYSSSKKGHPPDRIYVPTDSLEQITRYIGGEAPAIHRIGGGEWIKAKSRAKKAVKEIAGELIRLYAVRTSSPGFAFSPDTTWQSELEDSFAYVETPDQLVTIDEVKEDMQRPYPMDRIICGDVGYGKTEIAIRAAFKAVQDAKQVAVLVPTTLLAQQHLATFTQRYSGFPVTVSALSRFASIKDMNAILAGLASGGVDIVIGTHRLLSDDVTFRDLGLIIVDEEQRFGVEHKEKLKKLRASVDVLAMSATPIPRTLEMAITGIREMSTITTPPEQRHPVLTYVGAYDEKQVAAAIHRELLRDGQVFYIHNRVESIDDVAAKVRRLVPQARVAIAHGQMSETNLEQVVLGFWNREFDVLVCTTIVENGIDVANANTLIVERADLFGLSQLHQLRGRVGRSKERAYAYFFYPIDRTMSEVALDRLSTIAQNTELGAGMRVALKDLEIRGAGNLLGGEQSGHIADVGFDLFMRMVGDAVHEYKAGFMDDGQVLSECKVELPVTAHISAEYVPSDRLRLDLYRRLADAKDEDEITKISEELIDRFGTLPLVAENLLRIARLRTYLKERKIQDFAVQGRYVKIAPLVPSESLEMRIKRLYPGSIVKSVTNVVLIARPQTAAWVSEAEEIGDTSLIDWAFELAKTLLERP